MVAEEKVSKQQARVAAEVDEVVVPPTPELSLMVVQVEIVVVD